MRADSRRSARAGPWRFITRENKSVLVLLPQDTTRTLTERFKTLNDFNAKLWRRIKKRLDQGLDGQERVEVMQDEAADGYLFIMGDIVSGGATLVDDSADDEDVARAALADVIYVGDTIDCSSS